MNKKLGYLILFASAVTLIWGYASIITTIIIKQFGSTITAIVVKVDKDCDRYNKIEVLFNQKQYAVGISREDCRNGVYQIGQPVQLLKYDGFEELIWPESKPEWALILLSGLLCFSIAIAYKQAKRQKHKTKAGKRR